MIIFKLFLSVFFSKNPCSIDSSLVCGLWDSVPSLFRILFHFVPLDDNHLIYHPKTVFFLLSARIWWVPPGNYSFVMVHFSSFISCCFCVIISTFTSFLFDETQFSDVSLLWWFSAQWYIWLFSMVASQWLCVSVLQPKRLSFFD